MSSSHWGWNFPMNSCRAAATGPACQSSRWSTRRRSSFFRRLPAPFQGLTEAGHGGLQGLAPGLQPRFYLLDGPQALLPEIPAELQLLAHTPGYHLHLGQAPASQAAVPKLLEQGLQVGCEAGRFLIGKLRGLGVRGPYRQEGRLPWVRVLSPLPAPIQQELQGGEGVEPHLGLPEAEYLQHPVPDPEQFLKRGVFPQVQVEERQDMGGQPHTFKLPQELEIGLAQPHPGADDVERQVAFQQIGQYLGQVLGDGESLPWQSPSSTPWAAQGKGMVRSTSLR